MCTEANFSMLCLHKLHQQQTTNYNKISAVVFQIWECKGRECQLFIIIQFLEEIADKSNGLKPGEKESDLWPLATQE